MLIGERLHPEGNAVDACGAVARETADSTLEGLASSVISHVLSRGQRLATIEERAYRRGAISEGVPPPKKMLETERARVSAA